MNGQTIQTLVTRNDPASVEHPEKFKGTVLGYGSVPVVYSDDLEDCRARTQVNADGLALDHDKIFQPYELVAAQYDREGRPIVLA